MVAGHPDRVQSPARKKLEYFVREEGRNASSPGFAENVARDLGYRKLCMHARKTALGFYEKLGYTVAGEEFLEVTIPHFTMEKAL